MTYDPSSLVECLKDWNFVIIFHALISKFDIIDIIDQS